MSDSFLVLMLVVIKFMNVFFRCVSLLWVVLMLCWIVLICVFSEFRLWLRVCRLLLMVDRFVIWMMCWVFMLFF